MKDRFEGRINRKKWWAWVVWAYAAYIFIIFLTTVGERLITGKVSDYARLPVTDLVVVLGGLVVMLLLLAATARRYHDIDKSGWWAALFIIPLVGLFLVLPQCGFFRGTKGSNQFGPDPLDESEGPSWKVVSREDAEQSPYFGLRGWLLLFYVLTLLGIVNYILLFVWPPSTGYGDVSVTRTFLFFHSALFVPFLVLAPIKHPLMPKILIICIWISFVSRASPFYPATLSSASGSAPYFSAVNLFGVISAGLVAALITWYLRHSKRVNATYLNRVPAD